jgi:hypothetical protein
MRMADLKRSFLISIATVLAASIVGVAQNTQAPQKDSLWNRIKNSAKQSGQNAAQQGTQQVQQGAQQVQQGAQQMQQQVQQQIPGAGGQMNVAPQTPCGSLTGGAAGGTLTNAAYNGNGSAAGGGSCGAQCFNAGPFAAAVTQMTTSQQGSWHVVRMNVQFQNNTDQPLIIAYREGSMVMVDNLGNTYQPAGGYGGPVQGIGIDRGNQTDSQFSLAPGQVGNAMFAVARMRGNQSAIGTNYAYNFTIDELQPQNGAEAVALRQYNLNFPDLAPGASNTAFGAPGSAPAAAPVNNAAGVRRGRANGAGASSYVGGATAAPVMTAAPVQGGVAGTNPTSITPNGKGAAIGRAVSAPVQPQGVTPGRRPPIALPVTAAGAPQRTMNRVNPPVAPATPQRPVNNAAMRSNPAVAARPAPAAKPIPVRPPVKKTTTTPPTAAATK